MKCPSCNFEQSDGRLDCESCGLIFSKWNERHASSARAEAAPTESRNLKSPPSRPIEGLPLVEELYPHPVEDLSLARGRTKLYERLAALDFQRDREEEWIYFPWGLFSRGYQVKDPEMKDEIEEFVTLFCCIHFPLAAILGMTAGLIWFYHIGNPYQGLMILVGYMGLAYLFLWIRSRQWTSRLTVSSKKLDQKQYNSNFLKIFHWKNLVNFEMFPLFVILICLYMWLSHQWTWFFPAENFFFLWIWLAVAGLGLVLFSYMHYFKIK